MVDGKRWGRAYLQGCVIAEAIESPFSEAMSSPEAAFELEPNQRYGVWIGKLQVLDCHLHAAAGICKASMAISPRRATHQDTNVRCVSNVKCTPNPAMKRAYLCALRDIIVGEELLWDCGPGYELSGDEREEEDEEVVEDNESGDVLT